MHSGAEASGARRAAPFKGARPRPALGRCRPQALQVGIITGCTRCCRSPGWGAGASTRGSCSVWARWAAPARGASDGWVGAWLAASIVAPSDATLCQSGASKQKRRAGPHAHITNILVQRASAAPLGSCPWPLHPTAITQPPFHHHIADALSEGPTSTHLQGLILGLYIPLLPVVLDGAARQVGAPRVAHCRPTGVGERVTSERLQMRAVGASCCCATTLTHTDTHRWPYAVHCSCNHPPPHPHLAHRST